MVVRRLVFKDDVPDLREVSEALDALGPGHEIALVNWTEFAYRPVVRFNIGHNNREIFLKYYVRELYVKAEKSQPNQMVCEDSCVEFFVSPDEDGIYYNFEFNPIGTTLLGKGSGRADSRVVDPSYSAKIRRWGTLGDEPFGERTGDQQWELVVAIPTEAFAGKEIGLLSGRRFRANFYKCGDKLTEMHFLTWNPIRTGNPDFHRPEYFGVIEFE